ncbi:conserved hypothetical protein [Burkholderia pseudomallei 576]|nr:conserved hypothetical protein [Burkholderia pseudomallei 576]
MPTRFRHASPPFFPIDSPVRSRVWTGAGGDAFNDSPICGFAAARRSAGMRNASPSGARSSPSVSSCLVRRGAGSAVAPRRARARAPPGRREAECNQTLARRRGCDPAHQFLQS